MADKNSLKFKLRLALHEALGGNGWAYSWWGGDELESMDDTLDRGVEAIVSRLIEHAKTAGFEQKLMLILADLQTEK